MHIRPRGIELYSGTRLRECRRIFSLPLINLRQPKMRIHQPRIMFQRFAAVPYGRMQLVDINRGPLARALGLAELKLVTAASASNVVVPGLPMAVAEQLRDRLVELAESRRAGL